MLAVGPRSRVERRAHRCVGAGHGTREVAAARLVVHDPPVDLDPPDPDAAVVGRVERHVLAAALPAAAGGRERTPHAAEPRRRRVLQVDPRVAQRYVPVALVAPAAHGGATHQRLDPLRGQAAQLVVHPAPERAQAIRPAPQPAVVRRVVDARVPARVARHPHVEVGARDRRAGGSIEPQRRRGPERCMTRTQHVANHQPLAALRTPEVDHAAGARRVRRREGRRLPLRPRGVLVSEAGRDRVSTRERRRRGQQQGGGRQEAEGEADERAHVHRMRGGRGSRPPAERRPEETHGRSPAAMRRPEAHCRRLSAGPAGLALLSPPLRRGRAARSRPAAPRKPPCRWPRGWTRRPARRSP